MSEQNRDVIERLPELRPGNTLADRYTVLQVVGSGATSIVYKATDTLANEVVALKVIRWITPGSDRALDGFRRELTLARKLTHPNVIRIHDIGMDGRAFYIVMEYIDGQTLAQVLAEKGRFDTPQFFAIFHQFAEALRWIHQRNIVHRDVKPSNVMFTPTGVLKVTDFGIAKELGAANSTTRIGTPGYASPEQILGQRLTPASDIYSAGAMFFELLTATRPLAKGSLAEQCTLPPPSLGQARPDLPPLLCQVIEKCLQPDPANRYQTVDELSADMARAEGAKGSRRRLSELSSENPAELSQTIPLFLRVVNRVREIHAAGLAHDQLSPRNIWILPGGAVEIDSFPLPASSAETLVSEPRYVSPEAFAGGAFSGQPLSMASDIYVLGLVFYERLAGSKEFAKQFAQFSLGENDSEWLRWHADQAKKLLPLRHFRPDCPGKLESLLEGMLAKAPEKRIQSLDEVAGILNELISSVREPRLEPRPVEAQPAPSRDLTTSIPLQVPRGNGKMIGAVAVVILLAGVAAMGWKMLRPATPPVVRTSPAKAEPARADVPPTASANALQTATGTMVLLPKGEYKLGERGTPVTLGPLYVDKYEVTNGSYKKFCSEPGHTCPEPPAWDAEYASKLFRPVIGVTWSDADSYCKWAGKRLPSDAEWEAAARGTDQRKYPWGSWLVPGLANLGGSSEHTADVGSFPVDVSPSGAADMAGNAREWVSDDAPNGQKTVRGGSFDFPADQFTVTWKGSRLPGADASNTWPVGFRCVAEPEAAIKVQAKP